MKRTPVKKSTDRRQKKISHRSKSDSQKKLSAVRQKDSPSQGQESAEEVCHACSKDLKGATKALFVEEELGRLFCNETCISEYFSPEIMQMEKEYHKRVSSSDLSESEREGLNHLRWITLQEPDEVWRQKTLTGDFHYTLISRFNPGTKKIWFVCICLCLRGEPSFLYLAFPTRNASLVEAYRQGERIELKREGFSPDEQLQLVRLQGEGASNSAPTDSADASLVPMDGLADAWTEEELIRAELSQQRRADDIPASEFSMYQSCLEETLQSPDEVWSIVLSGSDEKRLYHFIRHYPSEDGGVWYVIVARETEDEDQIEILDAFPTRDAHLVERYRAGSQEFGSQESYQSRVVH